jgi:hypothetical protein
MLFIIHLKIKSIVKNRRENTDNVLIFKFNIQSFHYNLNKHTIIGTAERRYII